jgi:hypothetical protein
LGTKLFSHRTPGGIRDVGRHGRALEVTVQGRDHEQALVLDALRRAAGAPVRYDELRAAGVELPASVVSELELAGVPIERCVGGERWGVGVRLDPANDPAARPTPEAAQRPTPTGAEPDRGWSGVRIYRASTLEGCLLSVLAWLSSLTGRGKARRRRRPAGGGRVSASRRAMATGTSAPNVRDKPYRVSSWRRVLALTAILAGAAIVSAVVTMWTPGGDLRTRAAAARGTHRGVAVATAPRPRIAPRSTHPSPTVPVSGALATELEAQGHSLLEAGRYGAAVPVLKRAVLATGETLGACLEPGSSACLTYAYALYDLGRAVRLSGEPQAAVPILERRLQIDDHRSTVGAELQLARQGIG